VLRHASCFNSTMLSLSVPENINFCNRNFFHLICTIAPLIAQHSICTVTKNHTSSLQRSRTTLQYEQRSTNEWRLLRTLTVAKLCYWLGAARWGGVKPFRGLEACNLLTDSITYVRNIHDKDMMWDVLLYTDILFMFCVLQKYPSMNLIWQYLGPCLCFVRDRIC
jgi:hypothetical protein